MSESDVPKKSQDAPKEGAKPPAEKKTSGSLAQLDAIAIREQAARGGDNNMPTESRRDAKGRKATDKGATAPDGSRGAAPADTPVSKRVDDKTRQAQVGGDAGGTGGVLAVEGQRSGHTLRKIDQMAQREAAARGHAPGLEGTTKGASDAAGSRTGQYMASDLMRDIAEGKSPKAIEQRLRVGTLAASEKSPGQKTQSTDKATGSVDNSPGNTGQAHQTIIGIMPHPDKDDNAAEVGGILTNAVKKGVEKFLKESAKTLNPELGATEGLIEAGKVFVRESFMWLGGKGVGDLKDNKMIGPLMANLPAGILDGLADRFDVPKNSHNNLMFKPDGDLYRTCYGIVETVENKASPADFRNLEKVMKDPGLRRQFEASLMKSIEIEILSRSSQISAKKKPR